ALALLALPMQNPLRARATGLVDADDRARRELVLLRDAVDDPRHLIGAAAGAGGNDELDRLGGLPCGGGGGQEQGGQECPEWQARRKLHHRCVLPRGARPSRRGAMVETGCGSPDTKRGRTLSARPRTIRRTGWSRTLVATWRSRQPARHRASGTGPPRESATCPTARRPSPGNRTGLPQ